MNKEIRKSNIKRKELRTYNSFSDLIASELLEEQYISISYNEMFIQNEA